MQDASRAGSSTAEPARASLRVDAAHAHRPRGDASATAGDVVAVADDGRCGHGVGRRRPVAHLPAAPRGRDGRAGDRHRRRHDAGRVGDVLRAESERPGRRHRRSGWRRPDERAGVRRAAASRRPARAVLRRRLDRLLRHVGGGPQSEHDRDGARRARAAERGGRRRLASAHAGAAPAAIGVDQRGARRVGRRGDHRRIRRARWPRIA